MTDRELLELAAKAAGIGALVWGEKYKLGDDEIDCTDLPYIRSGQPDEGDVYWNPLTDDGDALRLAVQCGIEISIVDDEPGNDGRSSRACAGYATESDPRVRYVFEDHRGDLFAATRRAIVRAAAEIGRRMHHE